MLMAMRTRKPLKSTWPPGLAPSISPMLTVRAIWCSASLMGHCSFSSRCCTCKQYRACTFPEPNSLQKVLSLKFKKEQVLILNQQ